MTTNNRIAPRDNVPVPIDIFNALQRLFCNTDQPYQKFVREICKFDLEDEIIEFVSDPMILINILISRLTRLRCSKIAISLIVLRQARNLTTHNTGVVKSERITETRLVDYYLATNNLLERYHQQSLYDLNQQLASLINKLNLLVEVPPPIITKLPKFPETLPALDVNQRPTEGQLEFFRRNYKDQIKGRPITMLDGVHQGITGIFAAWCGTVAFILFESMGRKAIRIERLVRVDWTTEITVKT